MPYHIKTSENIYMFIKTIKNRNGVECKLQLLTLSYLLPVVRSTYLLLTYLFLNVLHGKGTFKKYVRSRFPNFDPQLLPPCLPLFIFEPPPPKARSFCLELILSPSISILVKYREKKLIMSTNIFD